MTLGEAWKEALDNIRNRHCLCTTMDDISEAIADGTGSIDLYDISKQQLHMLYDPYVANDKQVTYKFMEDYKMASLKDTRKTYMLLFTDDLYNHAVYEVESFTTKERYDGRDRITVEAFREGNAFYNPRTHSLAISLRPTLPQVSAVYDNHNFPMFERIIFHEPATIVYWADGTKTVVKCQEGKTFDRDAGIALCYMKKVIGDDVKFHQILRGLNNIDLDSVEVEDKKPLPVPEEREIIY